MFVQMFNVLWWSFYSRYERLVLGARIVHSIFGATKSSFCTKVWLAGTTYIAGTYSPTNQFDLNSLLSASDLSANETRLCTITKALNPRSLSCFLAPCVALWDNSVKKWILLPSLHELLPHALSKWWTIESSSPSFHAEWRFPLITHTAS